MKPNTLAALQPITQLDGTSIRLQQSGDKLLLCVKIGSRETSRQIDASSAERFWMGMKGALPATVAVEAMKEELLNAREKARREFVTAGSPKAIPA